MELSLGNGFVTSYFLLHSVEQFLGKSHSVEKFPNTGQSQKCLTLHKNYRIQWKIRKVVWEKISMVFRVENPPGRAEQHLPPVKVPPVFLILEGAYAQKEVDFLPKCVVPVKDIFFWCLCGDLNPRFLICPSCALASTATKLCLQRAANFKITNYLPYFKRNGDSTRLLWLTGRIY